MTSWLSHYWWLCTLTGALALVVLNSLKRSMDLTLANFLILLPILCLVQIGFWLGFRLGQHVSFISIWFIGSAMSAFFGCAAGIVLFDKGITVNTVVGVVMVVAGSYFLGR